MAADRSVVWSISEVQLLLQVIKDNAILQALDGKRYRNADVYKTLVPIFVEHGFTRSLDQIRTKWKSLQVAYRKAKSINNKSGSGTTMCQFYKEIDELLGSRPNAVLISEGGVESGSWQALEEGEYMLPVVTVMSGTDTSPSTSFDHEASSLSSSRDVPSTPVPDHSRKRKRTSYMATLNKISQQYADAQTSFRTVTDNHATRMEQECERQRKWEEKQAKVARRAQEKLMQRFFAPMMAMSMSSRSKLPSLSPSESEGSD